jgi:hypothetical protein
MKFDGGLINRGIFSISQLGNEVYGSVVNRPAGDLQVNANADVTFFGPITNRGTLHVGSNATATFESLLADLGTTGAGDVIVNGELDPDISFGPMSFGGDLTLGNLANLEIEIGGTALTEFARVEVGGDTLLDGSLEVALINGFTPQVGDRFEIVTSLGSTSGTFSSLSLPNLGPTLLWQLLPGPVTSLNVISTASADFNGDGSVNSADLADWEGDYSGSGSDADGDGDSDGPDFLIWQRLADLGPNSVAAAQTVPEPTSLLLLWIGILGSHGRGRSSLERRAAST